jgi:hypothetical protein
MDTPQTPISGDIPQRAPVSDDFRYACLWASLGLVPLVGSIRRDTDADQHHGESDTC